MENAISRAGLDTTMVQGGVVLGLYWDYIGIMENRMETSKAYWGSFGIMEKKMETTICDTHLDTGIRILSWATSPFMDLHEGIRV